MKFKQILSLFLTLCLCGCGNSAANSAKDGGGTAGDTRTDTYDPENAVILTDLFSSTDALLPESYGMHSSILPHYDRETGTITALSFSYEKIETDQNLWETVEHGWITVLSDTGEVLDFREISLPEEVYNPIAGVITEDTLFYVDSTRTQTVVYRTDLETGEILSTEDTGTRIEQSEVTYANLFTADADGLLYYTDGQTLYVLNPDLTLAFSFRFPTQIYSMACGTDGTVWVVLNAGMESVAAQVDKEGKKLGEYHVFTRGTEELSGTTHDLLNALITDSTRNFYYFDDEAVWGVTVNEDGSLTEERLIDLFNSGIPSLHAQKDYENGGIYAVALLSEDFLLTVDGDWEQGMPLLLRRTADVNLNETENITVAHAYALAPSSVDRMMEFGRENPGIRIVMQDYSIYATQEDPLAGENKLCFDLLNGIIEPDIVVTRASDRTVADNSVMRQLTKNNLYVDLLPYLRADDEINTETIFGCIPRLFDDGKGGMWGIATDFSLYTLLAGREVLGDCAEKGYWTAEEMFDFYDSLPEDAEAWYNFNQLLPKWQLFGQGYSLFIDTDGSSFTDGTFAQYLEFLRDAPATAQERRKNSPYVDLSTEERRAAMTLGKIGTDFMYILDTAWIDTFRMLIDEDLCPIGYATNTDSGIRIMADHAYAITTFAENPVACFELLKTFFVPEKHSMNTSGLEEWNIYALKAQVEDRMRQYSIMWSDIEMLTDEELAAVFDVIDGAGFPILELTPTAIDEIVEEEVSAYLAGVGTAENCAEKIQSRVDIYLAEHQ